jgi:hypothetical protein
MELNWRKYWHSLVFRYKTTFFSQCTFGVYENRPIYLMKIRSLQSLKQQ